MPQPTTVNFHQLALDRKIALNRPPQKPSFTYSFEPFFHPFVGDLLGHLNRTSLAETLAPEFLAGLTRDYPSDYTIGPKVTVDLPPKGSARAGLAVASYE